MTSHIFENTKEYKIVKALEKAGYEAYFVGGCIRDYLISNKSEDFKLEDIDITTSASPEQSIEALKGEFSEFNLVGARFGVLMVEDVEIAQFRSETYTDDSRGKPEIVGVANAVEDALRRDFTMNALYMDQEGEIFDFTTGIEDIENKTVKAVGNPYERFNEDPSRILRLFYLASRFEFSIDSETLKAAKKMKNLIKEIPDALVGKITKKVLSQNKLSSYLKMLNDSELLDTVYPEFSHTLNKPQNPKYHDSDVFEHTLRVIKAAETMTPFNGVMIMSAWCHDIAKGLDSIRITNDEGQPSDLGHEEAGVELSNTLIGRLQFGKNFADNVAFIVKWHGIRLHEGFKFRSYLKVCRKIAKDCSDKEQMIIRAKQLVDFFKMDAEGFNPSLKAEILQDVNACETKFLEIVKSEPFFIKELPITGGQVSQMWTNKKDIVKTKVALEELLMVRPKTEEEAIRFAEGIVSRMSV